MADDAQRAPCSTSDSPTGAISSCIRANAILLHGLHIGLLLTSIAAVLALLTYPITRGITARLARLQTGVQQFGAGNLSARVKVEGRDEVATLAKSFNESAERIEQLVRAHQMLLANCSHELRTPLARIRLGLERVPGTDPKASAETRAQHRGARRAHRRDAAVQPARCGAAASSARSRWTCWRSRPKKPRTSISR